MKFKYLILIFTLISTINSFGQTKSYDAVIDSSTNDRLGDLILFTSNYYKACFYYNELNYIDSLTKLNLLKDDIDTTGLYYCLVSRNKNQILLFYIDKLDSTKFKIDKWGANYTYKDCNNLFDKSQLKGCYAFAILGERQQIGSQWNFKKGHGVFFEEINIDKVKHQVIAHLLGSQTYFKIYEDNEDPDFWNRIKEKEFNKQ